MSFPPSPLGLRPESDARPSSFVSVLRGRALRQAERRAFTFLRDGEEEGGALSYSELDLRARALGALLQDLGADGERAMLLYPGGLEFVSAFYGCLYGGVIAVPAYPPHPSRITHTLPRLQAIISDSGATLALTTGSILSRIEPLLEENPLLASLHWVATDELGADGAQEWREPQLDGGRLAFLQYTSGSTAEPKGVMVSHANLLENSALIRQCFENGPESHCVLWLPPYHDMGLIGGVVQPVFAGFPATLMTPATFLQRPLRWLEAISRYRGTVCGGPNFAYDLCVSKTTPEQRAALDLSSWEAAFNGAEPVRAETLRRFAEAFAPSGFRPRAFYPCYGLAEATLILTGGLKSEAPVVRVFDAAALGQDRVAEAGADTRDVRALAGCGRNRPPNRLVIVNPETAEECGAGEIGEIWFAGPSAAAGYWNKPEETERTFRARLAGTGEGPFLRTGDLGFLLDGELFVTGRLKDLIIIAGRNHYPQDVERTAEQSHPALRPGCCAAFPVSVDGEERLVIAAEVERRFSTKNHPAGSDGEGTAGADVADAAGLIELSVRRAVAEQHDLHVTAVVLLRTGGIPKTSSGKIRRHACRAEYLAGRLAAFESQGAAPPEPAFN